VNPQPAKNVKIESIAKVLIVDNQQRALALTIGVHKANPKSSFLPDLPGGIVDPGESERDAAIRETQEEAGIDLDPTAVRLAYSQTTYSDADRKSVTKLLYIATIDNTPEVTLSWEHQSYEWVPLDTLLATTTFRPFFQEAIAYTLAHDLLYRE
jgi:8-oxo-dGTP pyrophosphatase MutT (NUDIX family)